MGKNIMKIMIEKRNTFKPGLVTRKTLEILFPKVKCLVLQNLMMITVLPWCFIPSWIGINQIDAVMKSQLYI